MDDYGNDSNNMAKLVIGVIIGLIVVLFVIPLSANIIATQTVANAASEALEGMDTSLPETAESVVPVSSGSYSSQATSTTTEESNTGSIDTSDMYIISGTITTGSSLSSKSECTVYVGKKYAGAKVYISTLYCRDGDNLNKGKEVAKTVDKNGYITVKSADAFDLYPDECLINLFDEDDNHLDNVYVTLETRSGTQSF